MKLIQCLYDKSLLHSCYNHAVRSTGVWRVIESHGRQVMHYSVGLVVPKLMGLVVTRVTTSPALLLWHCTQVSCTK